MKPITKTSSGPRNEVTEQRVVSCIVERGVDALNVVLTGNVGAVNFTDPACRGIFQACLKRHSEGLPFGCEDLFQVMKPTPEEAGVLSQSVRLGNDSMSHLPQLCQELRKLSGRRKLAALAAELGEAVNNDSGHIPAIVAEVLATQAESAKSRSRTAMFDAAKQRVKDAVAGKVNVADFISWGQPVLDRKFKPMRRGELVVIAAGTSVGKSSLARQVAFLSALSGNPVLFQSLEVSTDDVIDAMATAISGVPLAELERSFTNDQKRHDKAVDDLTASLLEIFEDRSLAAIVARVKAFHSQNPLALLIVDYLGLISDCEPGKGETKAQAVGRVTKAFKRLAMELNLVVVLLAQINRLSALDKNRPPILSDLRDSGDIEQDADRVVFIHRPNECPHTGVEQSVNDDVAKLPRYGCQLIQAKGRNVGTGHGNVWFNRRLARFEFATATNQSAAK